MQKHNTANYYITKAKVPYIGEVCGYRWSSTQPSERKRERGGDRSRRSNGASSYATLERRLTKRTKKADRGQRYFILSKFTYKMTAGFVFLVQKPAGFIRFART